MTPPSDIQPDGRNIEQNPNVGQAAQPYGAAAERTTLAWQRTGLGVIVCSFLVFHTAFRLGVLAVGALAGGLGLVVAALSVFNLPAKKYRQALPGDSFRLLVGVTTSVVLLGVLGALTGALTLFP